MDVIICSLRFDPLWCRCGASELGRCRALKHPQRGDDPACSGTTILGSPIGDCELEARSGKGTDSSALRYSREAGQRVEQAYCDACTDSKFQVSIAFAFHITQARGTRCKFDRCFAVFKARAVNQSEHRGQLKLPYSTIRDSRQCETVRDLQHSKHADVATRDGQEC